MNKPMKMKHVSNLAAVMAASLGVASAHASQNNDPTSQSASAPPRSTVANLAAEVRSQNGSPRRKADLYVAVPGLTANRNLVREVRYQNGSPRRKPDLYVAAPVPATDRDLVREIRNQNGSPRSKKD
jgi:hypothetical protein